MTAATAAPAHEGMIPDAIRAALESFRGTQCASWRLEVRPEDLPGEWLEVTRAPCTLTADLPPGSMHTTITITLNDGRTSIDIDAPDYPCTAARQAAYDRYGRVLIAVIRDKPVLPGDTLTWRAS